MPAIPQCGGETGAGGRGAAAARDRAGGDGADHGVRRKARYSGVCREFGRYSRKKEVFITTSKFSNDALDYVTRIEHKVILIGGETLAQFMIEHNVGVSEESHYIVKKVDLDYFEEG